MITIIHIIYSIVLYISIQILILLLLLYPTVLYFITHRVNQCVYAIVDFNICDSEAEESNPTATSDRSDAGQDFIVLCFENSLNRQGETDSGFQGSNLTAALHIRY